MKTIRGGLAMLALCLLAACGGTEAGDAAMLLRIETPAGTGSAQANFALDPRGRLLMSWLEPLASGAHALRYSVLADGAWQAPLTIAEGDNWFVNWADIPTVVPIDERTIVAHWLVLKPDQYYAYDIAYVVSGDAGATWSGPRMLNMDATNAEHGFVSFFPWADGFGAVWLDGRRLAVLTEDELFELYDSVGMTLHYARLDRSGAILETGELDELVCDCCRTGARLVDGKPVVVYRDREIGERRDVVVVRHDGTDWSEPLRLGPDDWVIDGCPVNGPAVAARGSDVAVAWFTAAGNVPRVRFARSGDGGAQFTAGIDIEPGRAMGQVDVAIDARGAAFVSFWRGAAAGGMELAVQRVAPTGALGELRVLATSQSALPVDVPQMEIVDGRLVVAWSELGDSGGIFSLSSPIW